MRADVAGCRRVVHRWTHGHRRQDRVRLHARARGRRNEVRALAEPTAGVIRHHDGGVQLLQRWIFPTICERHIKLH